MDVQCPDERAAGVICGADPYKELELYLEKVNEEIGEVFDRWKTSESKKSRSIPIPLKKTAPVPSPRRLVASNAVPLVDAAATNGHDARPRPRRRSEDRKPRVRDDRALTEWSDSFLAEFNGIIARELSELNGDAEDDDQVFVNGDNGAEDMMRIKVCRARSWDNYNVNDSDSSSQGRVICAGTPPPSPAASSTSDTSSGTPGRTSSLARVLRKHRVQIPTACETADGGAVLVRVASLPDADILAPSDSTPTLDSLPVPRERNAFSFSEKTSPRINRGDLGRVSFSENNTPKDRRKLGDIEIGAPSGETNAGDRRLDLSVDSIQLKNNLTELNALPNEIPTKTSIFDLEKNSRNTVPSSGTHVLDNHDTDTTIPDDITIECLERGDSQNISKNSVSLKDIFSPTNDMPMAKRNQSNDSGVDVNGTIWDAQADRLKLHEEDNLFFEEVDLDESLAGIPVEHGHHEDESQESDNDDDDLEDDLEDVLYTRVHAKRTDDDDHLSGILEENIDSEEDLEEVLSSSCASAEVTRSPPNKAPQREVSHSLPNGKDHVDSRTPKRVEREERRFLPSGEQHDLSRSLPDVQTCRSLPPRPSPDMTSSRPGRAPLPAALQSFLTKIRPRRGRGHSPGSPSGSLSPGASPTRGTSSPGGGYAVNIGTQTSPPLSRSSSFTWVSDCSSLALHSPDSDTLDDDNRSSSSSSSSSVSPKDFESYVSSRESPASFRHTDDMGCEFSSRDSLLSSSPPGSAESPERDEEPESGIGTASPPRSKLSGLSHKARRKETWERIRKRTAGGRPPRGPSFRSPEVWIRQENVETQTCGQSLDDTSNEDLRPVDSSSGVDDATTPDGLDSPVNGVNSLPSSRPRAVRPQWLAVKPQHLSPTGYKELPSPSTASLKMTTTPLPAELASKSSSAPLLMKQQVLSGGHGGNRDDTSKKRVLSQPRSQSERHLAEIEAGEACKWLRAAGFPQYAQMYEDVQFPIDVSGVQKDHPFLDPDSLQSLYRRLAALNRCAKMRVEQVSRKRGDDSDEDDACALSENWTFQPESRRWSRVCDVTAQHQEKLQALSASSQERPSGGNLEEEEEDDDMEDMPVINPLRYGSLPPTNPATGDPDILAVRFRRSGSERLRDGAKALLRRMESLKSRRRKRQHREGVVISGPQVLDVLTMNQRMKDLNCVDVSPVDTMPPPGSPFGVHSHPSPLDSSSYCSDTSTSSTPCHRGRTGRREDVGAMSDPESHPVSWRHHYLKDANSNHTKVLEFVDGRSRGFKDEPSSSHVPPRSSSEQRPTTARPGRTGSLNLGQGSQRYRDRHLHSLRRESTGNHLKKHSHDDSSSTLPSQAESDHEDMEVTTRNKYAVVRWHSFQRGSARPDSCLLRLSGEQNGTQPMAALSCGQLLVLRKLALLKLTACMERFCPTHRTGWNWELPKFIRKIKAPDYKDKTVFGVPLLLSLQRTGQALPKCIQTALRWLRVNALDQVGLFRKSGVRSRIQKLKQMTETQGDSISYEGQQAYDVADMVKQYFRELPEALLTNKLSETFIAIFQHVPTALRGEAVQWVLLLLPDEHREALHTLLAFLHQVSARSGLNQMTASNLAVCLAPSLFRVASSSRSSSASPRRRKTVGAPDARELAESRAAHDCLLYLISQHNHLFTVGEDLLSQCHFSYMEQSVPVALEELGAEFQQDWRGYLYACTTALLKEAREKSRGWVSVACPDSHVEMFYRKVGDGHPLRLWRVATEVEAPPLELLQRCLRERHVWDHSLLKWRVVEQLDQQVEVFQYVCANMAPSPAKDFCVVRSWRSDLPKGACVIVETSVEHPDAAVMLGGVRGIVLASRYLIEPCGSGRSRILHLSRVDMKGRTPEWYNKSYGHICALHLSRIRGSFKHSADGPESKV